MARRKRLLIDVDEVLVDFMTPTFGLLEKLCGRSLNPYDCNGWDMFQLFTEAEKQAVFAEIEKPGFCASLEPKPGSIQAVQELRELVDVFAVTTHFSSPTWVHERDAQLMSLFGFKRREIVHTSAKFLVNGHYFLDDNPTHVSAWMEDHPTGVAMLWHIPNTRNMGMDDVRVRTWDEVLSRVRASLHA